MLKVKTVTIETEGSDKGKSFVITAMGALRAERWATRALGGMVRGGLKNAEGRVGVSGLLEAASMGEMVDAFFHIPWDEAEVLMAEILACVQLQARIGIVRPIMESDIDEVGTLTELRAQWFQLQFGFFVGAGPSTSATKAPDEATS